MKVREFARRFVSDLPVKMLCVTAAVILFLFNRINTLSERFFSVPLAVELPAGFAAASAVPQTVRITLRGEEQSINPVLESDIAASINLENRDAPGTFRVPVQVARVGTAANVEPLEVRVEPAELSVSLEPLLERRISIVPAITGAAAYGYELTGYELAPRAVTIRGPRSRVQAVSAVATDEIDLTGRIGTFTLRVRLDLADPLVKIAGDAFVEFRATIQEAVVARRLESVPLTVVDLLPSLRLREEPAPGSVQVQGTQLSVEAVQAGQVQLLLDCASIRRPGSYTLHPRAEAPSAVTVLDWSPREVAVEIVAVSR